MCAPVNQEVKSDYPLDMCAPVNQEVKSDYPLDIQQYFGDKFGLKQLLLLLASRVAKD